MTPFFIPGVGNGERVLEDAYVCMRRQVELDMGLPPSSRRILSLWTRRGSIDCVIEVGKRDALRGGTAIAIFDMGPRRPFVVWWQDDDQAPEGVREILGASAYAVSEFDS
jgi:hypothetical protein